MRQEPEIGGLLETAIEFVARYVVLPGEAEEVTLALFAAHTYAIEAAHATPYLLVTSPERRSGKTRTLEVIELLVARPWRVTGASEAAMFRKIAKCKPTLMLDEIDAIFGSHSDRTEPLRALLNAGNRPGASVARCVGEKSDVQDFPVFCPKVLAGIDSGNRIPDTIRDRSIPIRMQRKTGAEKVERFRYRAARAESESLGSALETWALESLDSLSAAEPHVPDLLGDRAAEAWEPLLAVADLASGEWPSRARAAAIALNGNEDADEQTLGALLLGAIREAFGEGDRLSSAELRVAINADEELPFGGWRDGKGLDPRGLARMLKPYGVHPRSVRLGDGSTPKGFLREQFADAWERWLPPTRTDAPQAPSPPQGNSSELGIAPDQARVAAVAHVAVTSGADGLQAAYQRINAAYAQLPPDRRPNINGKAWKDREAAIDAAHRTGDSEAISQAIGDWERFALSRFKEASQ